MLKCLKKEFAYFAKIGQNRRFHTDSDEKFWNDFTIFSQNFRNMLLKNEHNFRLLVNFARRGVGECQIICEKSQILRVWRARGGFPSSASGHLRTEVICASGISTGTRGLTRPTRCLQRSFDFEFDSNAFELTDSVIIILFIY